MRLIRLSADIFGSLQDVHNFFLSATSPLRQRGPFATFLFGDQIREGGLQAGETLLFSYDAHVVYVAAAWSGREPWTGEGSEQFPRCFRINLATLRPVWFTVSALAEALDVTIPPSQGWQILPDGIESEWAVNTLCGHLGAGC